MSELTVHREPLSSVAAAPAPDPDRLPVVDGIGPDRTGAESAWRAAAGSLVAVGLVALLGAAMFPLRSHLSVATTALVLVIPVVAGVTIGGFTAGLVATATGFLVYDYVFIPPYYTLAVGAAQNWTALGVYAVVMVMVSRVVAQAKRSRVEAQRREVEARRLFDLSELLVRESSPAELLDRIVLSVTEAFALTGAALLLPTAGDRLELVAAVGTPLSESELHQLSAGAGDPVNVLATDTARRGIQAVALTAAGKGIGLLALRGLRGGRRERELLGAFANHLSLALERSQLQEHAVRAQLLEEIDRLRRSLVGAVSHDLRTPLATIKVAASALADENRTFSRADSSELAGLIDLQADRLDRLVTNLLDMTRIQSGALELHQQRLKVSELVDEALAMLGPAAPAGRIAQKIPEDLPEVYVDPVLIRQALGNLIDNAIRYAPEGTAVLISGTSGESDKVEVAVSDAGPGVAIDERKSIFQMINRSAAGGRGGLGLAIARAFVEVHGESIWIEDSEESVGVRFVFSLPVANVIDDRGPANA